MSVLYWTSTRPDRINLLAEQGTSPQLTGLLGHAALAEIP
jgi:hypothetical protein